MKEPILWCAKDPKGNLLWDTIHLAKSWTIEETQTILSVQDIHSSWAYPYKYATSRSFLSAMKRNGWDVVRVKLVELGQKETA